LQGLARSSGASRLRFWGKIKGTARDYWIAEGTAAGEETEAERQPGFEPRGTGVNECAYWVCNCPSENKWTILPDLEPSDI